MPGGEEGRRRAERWGETRSEVERGVGWKEKGRTGGRGGQKRSRERRTWGLLRRELHKNTNTNDKIESERARKRWYVGFHAKCVWRYVSSCWNQREPSKFLVRWIFYTEGFLSWCCCRISFQLSYLSQYTIEIQSNLLLLSSHSFYRFTWIGPIMFACQMCLSFPATWKGVGGRKLKLLYCKL